MKPNSSEETAEETEVAETAGDGRDSCADLDTLPPKVFFGRFASRIKEGSLWLNKRKRLWFEEAKKRIWPYLQEHGLKIKSSALGFKDGKAGIWITFLREDMGKGKLPSFIQIEEGQKGPIIRAWASVKELGNVFKKRHEDMELEVAMKTINDEIKTIVEQVRACGNTEQSKEKMMALGKSMEEIAKRIKKGHGAVAQKEAGEGDNESDESHEKNSEK